MKINVKICYNVKSLSTDYNCFNSIYDDVIWLQKFKKSKFLQNLHFYLSQNLLRTSQNSKSSRTKDWIFTLQKIQKFY
jgi:hypothetical protein